ARRWCTRPPNSPRRRCPWAMAKARSHACTRPATTCTTCANGAAATPGAWSRGNPRRDAATSWSAKTNSPRAWTWCWTGTRSPGCRTSGASAAWPPGSTRQRANRAAAACCCPASRRSGPARGPRTAMPACGHWPCCRMEAEVRTASLPHGVRARVLLAAATCLLPLLLALPGRFALGVAAACALAAVLSWRGHAPAWLKLALVLLLGTGAMAAMGWRFGRDTGCALLATMLALKPLELRAPRDARSLLGFALFAPFATFLLDQGPLSLALGLAGAIAALAPRQRLSEHESHDPRPQPATRHIRDVLRLVAAGLPLALAAFWLFPRLPAPLWGVPERALSQPGLSDSMEPGGWIDLMVDD